MSYTITKVKHSGTTTSVMKLGESESLKIFKEIFYKGVEAAKYNDKSSVEEIWTNLSKEL